MHLQSYRTKEKYFTNFKKTTVQTHTRFLANDPSLLFGLKSNICPNKRGIINTLRPTLCVLQPFKSLPEMNHYFPMSEPYNLKLVKKKSIETYIFFGLHIITVVHGCMLENATTPCKSAQIKFFSALIYLFQLSII